MTIGDIFVSVGVTDVGEMEYALWNETAYPFAEMKTLYKQIASYARAKKGNISRCELCGQKNSYHVHGCLNVKE